MNVSEKKKLITYKRSTFNKEMFSHASHCFLKMSLKLNTINSNLQCSVTQGPNKILGLQETSSGVMPGVVLSICRFEYTWCAVTCIAITDGSFHYEKGDLQGVLSNISSVTSPLSTDILLSISKQTSE